MKTSCSHYIIIDVACLTLSALYMYKGKNFMCIFFRLKENKPRNRYRL